MFYHLFKKLNIYYILDSRHINQAFHPFNFDNYGLQLKTY